MGLAGLVGALEFGQLDRVDVEAAVLEPAELAVVVGGDVDTDGEALARRDGALVPIRDLKALGARLLGGKSGP